MIPLLHRHRKGLLQSWDFAGCGFCCGGVGGGGRRPVSVVILCCCCCCGCGCCGQDRHKKKVLPLSFVLRGKTWLLRNSNLPQVNESNRPYRADQTLR